MINKTEQEVMQNWKSGGDTPLLSVCCITYNQEKYIAQALDSFLMQETDFTFEIIVRDDASTDGTAKIIRAYQEKFPNIIKPIYEKENGYQKGISPMLVVYKKAQGDYCAICEGDDFWVDALKLQKQVDFLENNPEYGLVHGDVNHLNDETGALVEGYNSKKSLYIPDGDIYDFLLRPSHIIKTMTVCLRRELLEKYHFSNEKLMKHSWRTIDISVWLMFAKYSKIHYFDEVFATYRLAAESLSRSKDYYKLYKFHAKIRAIRFFYIRNYGCSKETREYFYKTYYNKLFFDGFNIGNRRMVYRAKIGLAYFNNDLTFRQRVYMVLVYLKLDKFFNMARQKLRDIQSWRNRKKRLS